MSNVVLRGMGCRIGKRTLFAAPLQAYDWNAICSGDDCVVAGLLQYHSMENMTLRVKRTDVQDGSAVNFGATIMGGAVIEPNWALFLTSRESVAFRQIIRSCRESESTIARNSIEDWVHR